MTDTEELRASIEGVLGPEKMASFHHQCHAASLAVIQATLLTGLLPSPPETRAARGTHPMTGLFQHSWVVVGNPYKPDLIVDASLWSYSGEGVPPQVVVVPGDDDDASLWRPHGSGSIWKAGRPSDPEDEPMQLTEPEGGWSREAEHFLDVLGPLDFNGWRELAHLPMGGWPSGEIITQMAKDKHLSAYIPIDIIGMLTDSNPRGLYW